MMGKRVKIFSQILTAVPWQASVGSTDRASPLRDDARKANEFLCCELDTLQREHKKLKQIVDQLASDYEQSKRLDPLRRYERLKAMVKRTTMHLRLKQDESVSTQGSGISGLMQGCKDYSFQVENAKRREEKYFKLSRAEIIAENAQLQNQTRELRRKCSIIKDLIDGLRKRYDSSRRLGVFRRYVLLKTMIKAVIHDDLV